MSASTETITTTPDVQTVPTGFVSFETIITAFGVAIIIGLIYIGRKLRMLDDLKKSSDKIKKNLFVVSNYLTRSFKGFNSSELVTMSPFKLTEQGQELIKKIGFNNVFEEHKNDFFECISSDEPKLKYDVESSAIKSIFALYEKPYMKFLKVFLYNNPTRDLQNLAPTLGVYVRDEYLKSHPEITE